MKWISCGLYFKIEKWYYCLFVKINFKFFLKAKAGLCKIILIMMDQDQPDAIYELNLGRYKGEQWCFRIWKMCNLGNTYV